MVPTRTVTAGPELEVVRAFLEAGVRARSDGLALSIFCEPRLETGYPDVVLVHWDRKAADLWPTCRAGLTRDDVRLAHFLYRAGAITSDELHRRPARQKTERSLERLVAAGIVKQTRRSIRLRPLREIFAVRHIIALEAKISDWHRGLQQAIGNTWFASESFLLVPRIPKGSLLCEEAARLGIGIVSADRNFLVPLLRARRDRLPQSYASWLFNEWAWLGFGIASV